MTHPTLRVLLVEDDPDSARTVLRVLERAGLEATWVSTFSGFEEAVQEDRSWDAAVLDLHLPDSSDPMQTWERAMELGVRFPVIPMTGGVASGFSLDNLILKPDIEGLPAMIGASVERYTISALRTCMVDVQRLVG